MTDFVLFLIVAAIAYWWFIHRSKGMAVSMGKLVEHGIDIDARVVRKTRSNRSNLYLYYSFTLENNKSYSKEISPNFELWDSLNEGDSISIVYLPENPEVSATKEMVEKVKSVTKSAS